MATSIKLNKVVKRYGAIEVVHSIDLTVDPCEFTVFVGPSGCGKSTLLRMIVGLEPISGCELLIDGERMNEVPGVVSLTRRCLRQMQEGQSEPRFRPQRPATRPGR